MVEYLWFLVAGLALLLIGGEWLVRGASRLAVALGVPRLIIGLTLVAFGTSAPELAVSVLASFRGQANISVGNVVGSNIVNVLLILGLSAVAAPLSVNSRLIRTEVPIMIAVAVLFYLLGRDGALTRGDGLLLVGLLGAYLVWMARAARKDAPDIIPSDIAEASRGARFYLKCIGLVLGGLVGLAVGSEWLIRGAVALARALGASDLLIGLTLVAVGTSLPEMATSIIASVRGEREISVGNVVGSNIFNILSVLGISALVAPTGLIVASAVIRFDALVMIAVSLACFPVFFSDFQIKRWEGGLFVSYYVFYVTYLVLQGSQHSVTDEFAFAMRWFVLPLTALTLLTMLALAWHRQVWLPRREARKAR
jgi:cation:H+ antiporter